VPTTVEDVGRDGRHGVGGNSGKRQPKYWSAARGGGQEWWTGKEEWWTSKEEWWTSKEEWWTGIEAMLTEWRNDAIWAIKEQVVDYR
jgi:hypothetical protein